MTKVCTEYNWMVQYEEWYGNESKEERDAIEELMRHGVKSGKLATKDANGKVHKGRWWLVSAERVNP